MNQGLWQQTEQHKEVPADHYDTLPLTMTLYLYPVGKGSSDKKYCNIEKYIQRNLISHF